MSRASSFARLLVCILGGLLLLCPMDVLAERTPDQASPPSDEAAQLEEDSQAVEEVETPFEEITEPPPETQHGCEWDVRDQQIQEVSQDLMLDLSCRTFRWFDHLFGDRYEFDEEGVSGLLTFGAEQTQYDGFSPRLRLRVRAQLPNMSRRWDLLLGRVDEEAYVSDTQGQDATFYNPGIVNRSDDPGWLLGLGHRGKQLKSGWDYSLGVRLHFPPNPYVKAQWYFNHDFTEQTDLRFRQTFFWRLDDGFGTTSRGDIAYAIRPQDVLRWEGIATIHEETEGVEWYAGQTWYHLFSNRAAISLLAFANGETGNDVPLQDYGFRMIWRKPWTRDWIYLSIGPSVTWPRQNLDEKREMSLGFGLWVEMEFGDWHW